jgi:hypothetical protein
MATVLVITVKGNSPVEINKNLGIIDNFMLSDRQTIFNKNPILENIKFLKKYINPRIYFSEATIITKNMHDLINILKTDKTINGAIRSIEYAPHLNKV